LIARVAPDALQPDKIKSFTPETNGDATCSSSRVASGSDRQLGKASVHFRVGDQGGSELRIAELEQEVEKLRRQICALGSEREQAEDFALEEHTRSCSLERHIAAMKQQQDSLGTSSSLLREERDWSEDAFETLAATRHRGGSPSSASESEVPDCWSPEGSGRAGRIDPDRQLATLLASEQAGASPCISSIGGRVSWHTVRRSGVSRSDSFCTSMGASTSVARVPRSVEVEVGQAAAKGGGSHLGGDVAQAGRLQGSKLVCGAGRHEEAFGQCALKTVVGQDSPREAGQSDCESGTGATAGCRDAGVVDI
jgi:hypothetical protein